MVRVRVHLNLAALKKKNAVARKATVKAEAATLKRRRI
jgi:hypothetical protein